MLRDEVIVITGACGRIGSAVTRQCITNRAHVVLIDINESELASMVKKYKEECSNIIAYYCLDISTEGNIGKLIDYLEKDIKSPTGCVHCAYPRSESWGTGYENLREKDLYLDISKQLGGAILLSKYMLELFGRSGGGNLIHISSIQGIRAPKFEHYKGTQMTSPIEYTGIKSAIIGITKWLAKYHKGQNIRVNCVSPGGILDNQPEQFLERYKGSCSNKGMLDSNDVASTICFLLSKDAFVINGENIVVDDGWSL